MEDQKINEQKGNNLRKPKRCIGRTKSGKRCNRSAGLLFCPAHRFQLLTVFFTVLSLFIYFSDLYNAFSSPLYMKSEIERIASANEQIAELEQLQKSLEGLSQFVEKQKESIIESEKTLEKLKKEEARLKPLVETNKQAIEEIIRMSSEDFAERQSQGKWSGFVFGIWTSLFATILFELGRWLYKRHNLQKARDEITET